MATSHVIIVVVFVVLVFFFSGLFAIYFYKCFLQNVLHTRRCERSSSPTHIVAVIPADAEKPGLDPEVLDKFPTFVYSVVKQYRKPKAGRDCAICLLEFQDDHVLRLITICTHVFHQKCVDIWFKMHKTCPACRRNLELPADEEATLAPDLDGDMVSITIKDDDHEQKKKKSLFRSNSRDAYEDRFILQLPDHVTQELLKGNYNSPEHLDRSGSLGRNAYISGQGSDGNV